MRIPGYQAYASEAALELAHWALNEFNNGNRVKASKLKRIADKMEDKKRDSREYKRVEEENRMAMGRKRGAVTFQNTPLIRPASPYPMKSVLHPDFKESIKESDC